VSFCCFFGQFVVRKTCKKKQQSVTLCVCVRAKGSVRTDDRSSYYVWELEKAAGGNGEKIIGHELVVRDCSSSDHYSGEMLSEAEDSGDYSRESSSHGTCYGNGSTSDYHGGEVFTKTKHSRHHSRGEHDEHVSRSRRRRRTATSFFFFFFFGYRRFDTYDLEVGGEHSEFQTCSRVFGLQLRFGTIVAYIHTGSLLLLIRSIFLQMQRSKVARISPRSRTGGWTWSSKRLEKNLFHCYSSRTDPRFGMEHTINHIWS
jgi:hypothetical protein